MKHLLTLTLLTLFSLPTLASPPNFVIILADDLGYGDLPSYGSTINPTPHIDQLAAQGLRLTDFHSNGPMCTPTRAALLTGRYQQRFGPKFDSAISGKRDHDYGLPHAAVTLAEALKPLGYTSAAYGKWHLGYLPPFLPTNQGFDEFRGLGSGDGDYHTHVDRSGRTDWWHNNDKEPTPGYTTDLLTRYAVDFIERNQDQPFFLYVPHLAIHFPWQGPNDPPHRQPGVDYDTDKWGHIPDTSNVAPHVRAMIASLDNSVGAITQTLDRLNLSENTLVIFASDNGGYTHYAKSHQNISSNGPLNGQKGTLLEGGHRVPAIFRWTGRIQPGVSNQTAMTFDLFPTLLNFAGATPTQTNPLNLDGADLSPLLFQNKPLPPRTLFWRKGDARAVRQGPWKLLFSGANANTQLYNLTDDLGEQTNLADDHPQRAEQLKNAWIAWEKDVNQSAQALTR
jgi:arylsulfatase A-like enzyme